MKEILLLKYGEIVMKGLNRGYFDSMLLRRIRYVLKTMEGSFETYYSQSTLVVRGSDDFDMRLAAEKMKRVFGIASVCRGYECEKSIEAVSAVIKANLKELIGNAHTFKCVAKRSDKDFPLTSPEIAAECGGIILDCMPHLKVDVKTPDVHVTVEIRDKSAFVHGGGEKAVGGMPVGSNGRAMLLLSGGIDSPVAGYMIAKRGVELDAVYFESPPYTSEAAYEKVASLAGVLASYTGKVYLSAIPVTDIQKQLVEKCEEKLFTLLLRRFMMRIANRVAKNVGSTALVTGESIGQVASQTMAALTVTDSVTDMPVFRPCIGMDKDEIVVLSRKIGSFDISALPYEDCCTVFTPKHPNLRPTEEELLAEEAKLDIEGLIKDAIAQKRTMRING